MGNYAGQAPVAELSTLSRSELEARATSLRVACRDERKRKKTKRQLQEDCRLALEAQQSGVQQSGPRSGSVAELSALNWSELRSKATSLGVTVRVEAQQSGVQQKGRRSGSWKTKNQLMEDCRLALEAQQSGVQQGESSEGESSKGASCFLVLMDDAKQHGRCLVDE